MDSYNIDTRLNLASAEESSQVSENTQTAGSISSEPLDRYIHELRSDLRNELKAISKISWK